MMKARSILPLFMLLSAVAIAGAVPDQPFMQAAFGNLQNAKRALERATSDKAGHRVNAMRLVNNALVEVNAGIAYDRRHNHPSSLTPEALFAAAADQPHMQDALNALENAR